MNSVHQARPKGEDCGKEYSRQNDCDNRNDVPAFAGLKVAVDGDTVDKKFMVEVVRLLALENKLNNMPNNLSGGQQQRVAIARALIAKPAIVPDSFLITAPLLLPNKISFIACAPLLKNPAVSCPCSERL